MSAKVPKVTLGLLVAGLVMVAGAVGAWQQLGFPMPASEAALKAVEDDGIARIEQVSSGQAELRSRLLNDQRRRATQEMYDNMARQDAYRAKGQAIPPWLFKEKGVIDSMIRELDQDIRRSNR